jgi:DNA-binding NarL/FixJ family response regulator
MGVPKSMKQKLIQILIVDDHKVLRQGLKKMISSLKPKLTAEIWEADSGAQAMLKVEKKDFDLIIMDYQMPDSSGLETIRRILRFKTKQKIIILSNYDTLVYVESVMGAGAKGYLLKSFEADELLKAINTVISGKKYYSNEIAIKLLEASENNNSSKLVLKNNLTKREVEVLKLIAMEFTDKQISEKLFISIRTVGTHRQNLKQKLNVKNTAGLVKAAIKMNLMDD